MIITLTIIMFDHLIKAYKVIIIIPTLDFANLNLFHVYSIIVVLAITINKH